jgi:hypothetical protein
MMTGKQDHWQLAKLLSPVEERKAPPVIRDGIKVDPPFDPLA